MNFGNRLTEAALIRNVDVKLGIFSDIHEDHVALSAAIRRLEQLGANDLACLGDIVGYSAPFYTFGCERDANRAVELVRTNCKYVVVGNHDLFAIKRIPAQNGFFQYPNDWYLLDIERRRRLSAGRVFLYEDDELPHFLTSRNLDYLGQLPDYEIVRFEDHGVLLSHYASPDNTGSSTWQPNTPSALEGHFRKIETSATLYGFSGNDHVEGVRIFTRAKAEALGFGAIALPRTTTWLHGPCIARGMSVPGYMIYDARDRRLVIEPLAFSRGGVLNTP